MFACQAFHFERSELATAARSAVGDGEWSESTFFFARGGRKWSTFGIFHVMHDFAAKNHAKIKGVKTLSGYQSMFWFFHVMHEFAEKNLGKM